MQKPKTLGLWANTDKDIFWNILPEIIEWAERKKIQIFVTEKIQSNSCLLYTSPSPRDATLSRMPSSA